MIYYSTCRGSILKYNWDSRRHCNAEYELHYITRGGCKVNVEDTVQELQSGQAILIAPGKYHEASISTCDFEMITFGFSLSDGKLSEAAKNDIREYAIFTPSSDFIAYCDKLIAESSHMSPLKDAALYSLLSLIAISVFRDLHLAKSIEPDKRKRGAEERKHEIDDFFEQNLSEIRGASSLAQKLHLSTRQLNRVLNEYYGMGFQEKLIKKKMDYAALLLRTTNKSILDIISAVGYNSQTAFYRAFIGQFGDLPQEYRKKHK